MKSHFIEATVLICSIVACAQTSWSPKSYCLEDGDECPNYKDVASNTSFVERFYNTSRWLETKVDEPVGLSALMAANTKLNEYIASVFGDTFPPTKPFAVTILYSADGTEETYFLSRYVPPEMAISSITDPSISLYTMDAGNMFVKVFSGRQNLEDWRDNVRQLEQDLSAAGKQFGHSRHMVVAYETIVKLWLRHDEVWIPAA